MDMHSLATVSVKFGDNLGQIPWYRDNFVAVTNLVIYATIGLEILKQNVSYSEGVQRQTAIRKGSISQRLIEGCRTESFSHSWTPQLNILEISKHFWPASEPCRQATIKDMDFMFPVPSLPSLT